jgi:hypothetical protein
LSELNKKIEKIKDDKNKEIFQNQSQENLNQSDSSQL